MINHSKIIHHILSRLLEIEKEIESYTNYHPENYDAFREHLDNICREEESLESGLVYTSYMMIKADGFEIGECPLYPEANGGKHMYESLLKELGE